MYIITWTITRLRYFLFLFSRKTFLMSSHHRKLGLVNELNYRDKLLYSRCVSDNITRAVKVTVTSYFIETHWLERYICLETRAILLARYLILSPSVGWGTKVGMIKCRTTDIPHGENFMAIFTTLSVVYVFTMHVVISQWFPHYRLPYCFVIRAIYYCEFHHAVWWE